MAERDQIDYRQMEAGFEFPPARYRVDSSAVGAYLATVEEDSSLYADSELVPPMAIAAQALAAMSKAVTFPAGSVHVSQVVEFTGTVSTEDTITSRARVGRAQKRGRFHLLSMEIIASKDNGEVAFRGRTDFILPQTDEVSES